jgi:AAA15 family ATPase/GTPase
MKAIYLDNFRGFQDSLINLKEVNFLVGENSAGKSSFLSIFKILSDLNFLFSLNFNQRNGDSDLGGFEDIVSAESHERGTFTIGAFEATEGNSLAENLNGVIVSYSKDDARIVPNKITYIEKGKYFIIKNDKKSDNNYISYQVSELSFHDDIDDVVYDVIYKHKNLSTEFEKLVGGAKLDSDIPFPLIKHLINEKLSASSASEVFQSVLFSSFPSGNQEPVVWIAPIREKPKRIYDNIKPDFSPEGTHIPYILDEILNKDNRKREKFVTALREFGTESGLFSEIASNRFGKTDSSPFEVNVTLHKAPIKISNVGYGVSQVLPIIVDSFRNKEKSIFCIQQPEVHLHPKAQAALGKFFFKLASLENKNFLIETHSDFLIDRYRYTLAKDKEHKPSSQILYFERVDGFNKVTPIEIESNGKYSESQPDSFREFFLNEQLSLLEI